MKVFNRLFQKKFNSETPMNESWNKHIQPILDSWKHWDNYSWVWDPFYEKYPKFSEEQKAQVDDALVTCAFDSTHEVSATKAFAIVGFLQNNHLATQRLSEGMTKGLRERMPTLDANSALTLDYVVAFKFFGVKEAIPYIEQLVLQLEERKKDGSLDERPSPHSFTFRQILDKYLSIIQELKL